MPVVDTKTFWAKVFDANEAKGLTVRVGEWRCAPLGDKWACLNDDGGTWTRGPAGGFATRQDAVDFMAEQLLSTCSVEQHYA